MLYSILVSVILAFVFHFFDCSFASISAPFTAWALLVGWVLIDYAKDCKSKNKAGE